MKKVKFSHVSNNKSQNRTLQMNLLVATNHAVLDSLGKVLSKNLNILYMNEKLKKVLYPGPWFHFEMQGNFEPIF